MILLSSDYIYITYFSLHWFRDIYRRYFLRNIPIISLADYKEKIEIYTKYLEKKISLSRWQIFGSTQEHFAGAQDGCKISQAEADFAACRIGLQLGVIDF